MRFDFFAMSVSSLALAASANAAEPTLIASTAAAVEAAPEEEPIIIEGERSSYGAAKITSATKTQTDVRNIPQAMTIVTKAQIDDQQLRSVGDIRNLYSVATSSAWLCDEIFR